MSTEVKLPRLGQGMESGVIVRWLKSEGDSVSKGEPLYELDTDKVTQEVEAEVDGTLQQIVVAEGEVEVGATVAVIDDGAPPAETAGAKPAADAAEAEPAAAPAADAAEPKEPAPAPAAEAPAPAAEETAAPPAATDDSAPVESTQAPPVAATRGGGRVKASPLARRIARERGVDLLSLEGTGPDGRILAEDVEKAAAAGTPAATPRAAAPAAAEVEVVQLTSIRKTIARRLTEAWAAPVFQLGVTADMAETLGLREKLVERLPEGDAKPTVNDVLVKLAAVALTRHPPINATFSGEEIHRYPNADVGIAVAAPQGLVVPVIRDAARKTIQEIARARADLVGRARDNKLTLADLEGGTFTISNLGMFGVEQFTAVLNPPQVAILAVGAVKEEAVVRDGELEIAPILRMILTCDHRAIDGADGAQFLQTLVALLEQPTLAL
ncbi:MAG TPA: dihydrolipoamide acetyltransferase family protein [Gaiella sp.]|uniref:dihydrolipoamide acetyltransferase family protein n=1 Tax=Gaiella sp. TaxID=2663207 RepID=UPI002D7F890E|nr:dihydrolipoamide acetyltransferase family protein [Gaiella sp.]HET9287748.1 dihydrolipoamide acetyltransferase family protein [Gaiella sp.]